MMSYKYYVIGILNNGDERTIYKTSNLKLARFMARHDSENPLYDSVEIRSYDYNIEDDDCFCFDHKVIDF